MTYVLFSVIELSLLGLWFVWLFHIKAVNFLLYIFSSLRMKTGKTGNNLWRKITASSPGHYMKSWKLSPPTSPARHLSCSSGLHWVAHHLNRRDHALALQGLRHSWIVCFMFALSLRSLVFPCLVKKQILNPVDISCYLEAVACGFDIPWQDCLVAAFFVL